MSVRLNQRNETILVTGTAGFIGFHLAKQLSEKGIDLVGLDAINEYYNVNLKYERLEQTGIPREMISYGKIIQSRKFPGYRFIQAALEDKQTLDHLFEKNGFATVVHLAAQAGVRYSLTNPYAYLDSNLHGFLNILEACKNFETEHLIYASSSSVYGLNKKTPFSISDQTDSPASLYAATKRANELMAHTYSHLFGLRTTGLRFFTVYGPWGRPDMSLFIFVRNILKGKPIEIFNNGDMVRDFTYIDDIIEGITRVINKAQEKPKKSSAAIRAGEREKIPFQLYNIGNSDPVQLMDFIAAIEESLQKKAIRKFMPMQPGEVRLTHSDTSDFEKEFGFRPKTSIYDGVEQFVQWYNSVSNTVIKEKF
jgi:UDP-glucuronate 4-epimerase